MPHKRGVVLGAPQASGEEPPAAIAERRYGGIQGSSSTGRQVGGPPGAGVAPSAAAARR